MQLSNSDGQNFDDVFDVILFCSTIIVLAINHKLTDSVYNIIE